MCKFVVLKDTAEQKLEATEPTEATATITEAEITSVNVEVEAEAKVEITQPVEVPAVEIIEEAVEKPVKRKRGRPRKTVA
ncbi:hypothetical protein TWF696_008849 [Orbilia brochopaga]|uniref:Uncharacterized protein n=1 Tax=Orbilia brochopaga TaxID=3140254 RepID=A0AAV9UDE2_9PEZI